MKKFGKRFSVLMVSADAGYFGNKPEVHKRVKETLARSGTGWHSVVVPDGWDGINRTLGQDGYILTLVDSHGIVRAADVRGEELDALVARYAPNALIRKSKRARISLKR